MGRKTLSVLAFLPVIVLLVANTYVKFVFGSEPPFELGGSLDGIMISLYSFLISLVLSVFTTITCLVQIRMKKKLAEKIGYYLFLTILSAVPLLLAMLVASYFAIGQIFFR